MKILKLLKTFRKSLCILLISITIFLSYTNSLILENNARLKIKNTEQDQKAISNQQNFLNPQIVPSLTNAKNEANRNSNPIRNSDSLNTSFNSNNNRDKNFRKLYDDYESVKTIGRSSNNNNNAEENIFVSSRAQSESTYNYAKARENVLPKVILSHNVEVIRNANLNSPSAALRVQNYCPCAQQVKCRPCNGFVNLESILSGPIITDCPCAPKPKCPACPPLSLLHDIASKKALHDQKMADGLKNLSGNISKVLDLIIRHAGDVVKFEKEAVEASKKMEEASIQAQIARTNMITTSEKARFIAKTGIVDRNPCDPAISPCMPLNEPRMDFFNEKIFPEEVDNIKSYMTDTFTTNVNGFSDSLRLNAFGDEEIAKFSRSDSYYNGKRFLRNNYARVMNSGFMNDEENDYERSLRKYREKKVAADSKSNPSARKEDKKKS